MSLPAQSILSESSRDTMSLDTLPLEVFHNIAANLPPQAIWSLSLVCRVIHSQVFARGPHLWKELVQRRYDPLRRPEGVDWKYTYQSRLWVEKLLIRGTYDDIPTETSPEEIPKWKVFGVTFLQVLRDMVFENDCRNETLLRDSNFVDTLRKKSDHIPLPALLALFLSPVSKFNPHLDREVFSAAQKAVYVPSTSPLFNHLKTPNFPVILSILKFFQHHLDHMQHHIGPVTRAALSWHDAGLAGTQAFQPGPRVTKHNFEHDLERLEGDWIGLYSYLGWADFEALRDGNPAVLESNRTGHLRDYLGGPQRLSIRIPKDSSQRSPGNNGINITGDGVNGGSFTFSGKLRRVYLPRDLAGHSMHLYWRITFVKTYANGENSWTRWIYDGIYCPGVGILGRWRDGTEPAGTGVTGPFWLWPKGAQSSECLTREVDEDMWTTDSGSDPMSPQ